MTYKQHFLPAMLGFAFFVATLLFTPFATTAQTDQSVSNLWDVVIRFCNENATGEPGMMKKIFLEAETGEPEEICMYINNEWPTDVDVLLNFVDGTITADGNENKACQPEWTKTNFWQYVSFNTGAISVPAWTTVETRAQALFPEGYAGMSYGCVTMQIAWEETTDTGMFEVLSRRGYFVDFLVDGDLNVWLTLMPQTDFPFDNMIEDDLFTIYQKNDGSFHARLLVENPGNVAQRVEVIPQLQAIWQATQFWKNITNQVIQNDQIVDQIAFQWTNDIAAWKTVTKTVLPNQSVAFEFPLDEGIPLWKWPIQLALQINHTPQLDFVDEDLQGDLLQEQERMIAGSIFLIPWIPIGILIVLLLLLLGVSRKKKKDETNQKDNTTD